MSIMTVLLIIAILCLALYGVQAFMPGPAPVKSVLCLVLVAAAIVYLLRGLGAIHI